METSIETPRSSQEEDLRLLLKHVFGYGNFRSGQIDILRSILSGRDTVAVMPTGGGKSLCYQLPALYRKGVVLVVSPLISLMRDQVQALRKLGVAAGALHSGQPYEEKREIFNELRRAQHYIVFVSPERIQTPGFAEWVQSQPLSLVAIDEAHCISQWGSEFRQDYHRLDLLRKLRPEVPLLALTATATPTVMRDISNRLGLKNPARFVFGFYRRNLYIQVETCTDDNHKRAWLRESLRRFTDGRIIVYCGTRKKAEELSQDLAREFNGVEHYHAGLGADKRKEVEEGFAKGTSRILMATNAFGMGIDHPDVRLVVHYAMPSNLEAYYQEIGRAGRDGEPSTCLMLYAKRDRGLQSYFIQQAEESSGERAPEKWRALDSITDFCERSNRCRHRTLIEYFSDPTPIRSCDHCDVCVSQSSLHVATPFVQAHTRLSVAPSRAKKSLSAEALSGAPLTNEARLRYEHLQQWRREYAEANEIPAFVVFSNKTLRDLSEKNPSSLDELRSVYGFGEKKVEHIGPLVLSQLAEFS